MRNFFQKIAIFMQGRYGTDKLNNFLMVVFFILWVANIFVFNRYASLVVYLCQLAVLGIIIFRALSRNITKRSAENRTFTKIYTPVANFFSLTFKKIRDRKDFRYIRCPACKAQLRVKNTKGMHTVRCPKCGSSFKKKI